MVRLLGPAVEDQAGVGAAKAEGVGHDAVDSHFLALGEDVHALGLVDQLHRVAVVVDPVTDLGVAREAVGVVVVAVVVQGVADLGSARVGAQVEVVAIVVAILLVAVLVLLEVEGVLTY